MYEGIEIQKLQRATTQINYLAYIYEAAIFTKNNINKFEYRTRARSYRGKMDITSCKTKLIRESIFSKAPLYNNLHHRYYRVKEKPP